MIFQNMKAGFVCIILISMASCVVKIVSPPELSDILGDKGVIQSSIANFGHIPYGQTIIGQAVFIEQNEYGCNSFGTTLSKFDDLHPIVFVRRGKCSFVQKVRNVEHGGGKLAIIVDEKNDENVKFITMVDDGTGSGIMIPSIMINKDPGEIIIDYVSITEDEFQANIKLKASFGIANKNDDVAYDLVFSVFSDQALDFIKNFRYYHDKLKKRAIMTPHYISWPCPTCNSEIKEKDCFGQGKYCAIDIEDMHMSGKDLLLGNIRQKCIYNNSLKTKDSDIDWWDYMIKAHMLCYDDFTEDCSKMIHERLELDYSMTEKCVNDSFINRGTEDEDNAILGEDYEFWVSSGYTYVPAVMINSVRYEGDFVPEYIFEAMCSAYYTKPEVCTKDSNLNETTTYVSVAKTPVKFNWFVFIIIILIVLNVLLVCVCIKRNKDVIKIHVKEAMGKHKKYAKFDKSSGGNKL